MGYGYGHSYISHSPVYYSGYHTYYGYYSSGYRTRYRVDVVDDKYIEEKEVVEPLAEDGAIDTNPKELPVSIETPEGFRLE